MICLPETFLQQGVAFDGLDEVAETVPGPTTDAVSAYARDNACYFICPLIAPRGVVYTNDAVLMDRRGRIAGAYSKIHPVVEGAEFSSLERGVTPGTDVPVFETDLGRIIDPTCRSACTTRKACSRSDRIGRISTLLTSFASSTLTSGEYLARNARRQDAWHQGEPIPDLTPSHVGRVQST